MKRTGLVILAVVFGLAVLFALIRPAGSEPEDGQAPKGIGFSVAAGVPVPVDVTAPRRGPIAATIEAPGAVRAGSEVGIGARFEGIVAELCKDVGDPVVEGEVVFRLDPTDKQEAVDEAEIDLARNQAALAQAQTELKEAQRLFDTARREPSTVTEARLLTRQSELSQQRASAQLGSATNRLTRAESLREAGIGLQTEVEAARDEERIARISKRIADEELKLAQETLAFRVRTWEESQAEAAKNLEVARVGVARAEADERGSALRLEQAQRDPARWMM